MDHRVWLGNTEWLHLERDSWSNLAGLPSLIKHADECTQERSCASSSLESLKTLQGPELGTGDSDESSESKAAVVSGCCYHSWPELMNASPCFLSSCSLMWILAYFISLCTVSVFREWVEMQKKAVVTICWSCCVAGSGLSSVHHSQILLSGGLAVEPRLPWSFYLLSSK